MKGVTPEQAQLSAYHPPTSDGLDPDRPQDLLLPAITTGLTPPTHCCFLDQWC